MKKQAHVYYSGDVHGVGFRYTAERLANNLGLTGWVRNIPDGRVELLAEGDESAVNDFLSGVSTRLGRYIQNADVEWREPTGKLDNFRIN